MSYKALYRKYRPQKFEEVIAQDHIIATLKNIIQSQKISHAYLFCGPRGTGKTSVAHIFARAINQTPANFNAHDSLDIVEVDAASHNGVAEVRRLINNSNYAPTHFKYKVYIIDEVHMMTKGAFNALLKTLEEPPAHLVFILATTEPHKIPTTILSRAQRFNFKRIADKLIVQQVQTILDQEAIKYEQDAIKFVARIAQGGMRDALSIVDQAAAYSNNDISFVAISQVFGIISISNQIKILNLVYEQQTKALLIMVADFFNNGIDIDRLINSLIDIIKDYIVFKKTSNIKLCSMLVAKNMNELTISVAFAYEAITSFVDLLTTIKFSEAKKQLFEITLLKLSESSTTSDNPNPKPLVNNNEAAQINREAPLAQALAVDSQADPSDLEVNEVPSKPSALNLKAPVIATTHQPEVPEPPPISSQQDSGPQERATLSNQSPPITTDDLINYLQHADKTKIKQFKIALPNVINWIDKIANKDYVTLIEATSFISAGPKFVILSSLDETVVTSLKTLVNNQDFNDLMTKVLGEPVHTIIISKVEFKEVRAKWEHLVTTNSLPPRKPIQDVVVSTSSKTSAEKFGENLFGDLFE